VRGRGGARDGGDAEVVEETAAAAGWQGRARALARGCRGRASVVRNVGTEGGSGRDGVGGGGERGSKALLA